MTEWNNAGILYRELDLYDRLQEKGVETCFISYGGGYSETQYQKTKPFLVFLKQIGRAHV